jgi:hypothetical protein
MIRIAMIHPSFGRPTMAFDVYLEWMANCDHPEEVEYLLGLDDNDPAVEEYRQKYSSRVTQFGRAFIAVGDSRNIVQATNGIAKLMSPTTELIVSMADDEAPCPHWDTELLRLLEGVDNFKTIKFIGVSDGIHLYGPALLYLIVNRAWYTRFGYLVYPEYDGVFADNDYHNVATRLGCIIDAPQLLFRHRHYIVGLSEPDATYARNNNRIGSQRNLKVFLARAERNFDL